MNKFFLCLNACWIILASMFLVACPRPGVHYRDMKEKVEEIGPDVLREDAEELMVRYSGGFEGNSPFETMADASNSFSQFNRPVNVRPGIVSVTTAGLGSHRMGIMVVTDEATKSLTTNANTKLIAENIYYWAN